MAKDSQVNNFMGVRIADIQLVTISSEMNIVKNLSAIRVL